MPAESLYAPISEELIRQARSRLALAGLSVEDWARREGFAAKTVYNVLSGRRMAIRGVSLQIAIKLGLRQDPNAPAPAVQQGLPESKAPAGRTLAGGPSVSDWDRRPKIQLGEAAR